MASMSIMAFSPSSALVCLRARVFTGLTARCAPRADGADGQPVPEPSDAASATAAAAAAPSAAARVSAGPLAPEASPTSAATAAAATALHRAKSKPNPPPPPPPPPPPRPEAGGCELRLNCAEKCIPSPRSCELSLPPPLTWPPSSPSPAMAKPHELPLRSASHIASISDTSVAMETRTEAKRTHQSQCCTIFSASSKF